MVGEESLDGFVVEWMVMDRKEEAQAACTALHTRLSLPRGKHGTQIYISLTWLLKPERNTL